MLPLVCCGLLMGCASAGKKFDADFVEVIEPDVTTLAEVEMALGKPQLTGIETREGVKLKTYTYSYSKASVKAETFIPYVGGTLVGGDKRKTQTLTIYFNKDDTVNDFTFNNGAIDSGINFSAE